MIDRRALEYSPYAIERTTAAARKQLLKFVEDDDAITGREIAFKEFLKVFLVRPLDWLVDAQDNCEVEPSQA